MLPQSGRLPSPPFAFDPSRIIAPAPLAVDVDDVLFLEAFNSVANLIIVAHVRFMNVAGDVTVLEFTLTPTTNRASSFASFPFGPGYVLGITLVPSGASPRRGQCFARCGILRYGTASGNAAEVFVQDYLAVGHGLAWPGGIVRQSVEGPGVPRSIAGTDPGAGVECSDTVPTGARWLLRAWRVQLVASAAVANRRVHLVIDDGATTQLEIAAADLITAAQTRNVNAAPDGYARATQDSEIYLPLPGPILLGAGWRLRTSTTAADVGDNYGAPRITVEEWIEP